MLEVPQSTGPLFEDTLQPLSSHAESSDKIQEDRIPPSPVRSLQRLCVISSLAQATASSPASPSARQGQPVKHLRSAESRGSSIYDELLRVRGFKVFGWCLMLRAKESRV